MTDKLTDEQVADLLALLRKDASIDAKVQMVGNIKSGIKQHNVPETCVSSLFEALRLASTSPHSALVNAGFTALNHLITRLSRQEPKMLAKEAKHTLPLIVDKLGDSKDKMRSLATQALSTMYGPAPMEVERFVKNTALVGKNPRAKESGMQWLLQMHKENGLQFRAYVPTLMELLEDADGMVRDTAKGAVIELFRDAPNAAKSDLKRQLKNFKVRPAIEAAIVKELAPTPASRAPPEERPDSAPLVRPNLSASVSSLSAERPNTPMLETQAESVEPSYVNTARELDEIFKAMHEWFEGKESEHNWMKREESITKLRQLITGNATDFTESFVAGCRALLDGIIKGVISLRTSLSKESCALVQELAKTFGPAIDPMVELLMQTFIKLAANTKKIASQMANITVDIIIANTTYNARLLQHIWGACQDKNVSPRTYATGWLVTLIKKEAHHKSHVEHGGGVDVIEKCIKKCLGDPIPGVREKMRATYWAFAGVWPARAEAIMDGLDGNAQKLLQKDPNNPNSPKRSDPPPRPGLGLSKSTITRAKPSLREAMMAQKKALTTQTLPPRPGSAMASVSPVRTVSNASSTSTASTSTAGMTRSRADLAHGGMSVAPMRPGRRRPEMAPRPATAGPYSGRNHDGPPSERSSPHDLKVKTATPKTIVGSPRRTVPRPRPGHNPTLSESSVPTPSKAVGSKPVASPRMSPSKVRAGAGTLPPSSPAALTEEPTLIVPTIASLQETGRMESPRSSAKPSTTADIIDGQPDVVAAGTQSKPLKVYEDPFTDDQATPRPVASEDGERAVLEDRPVNEDAINLAMARADDATPMNELSPEKSRQNSRILESGLNRVKAQSLDVHGFRKLQSLIRDNKPLFTDDKYETLIVGLFEYLESPLASLAPEKVQDVKAQVLATIKLLLKKARENFQPHVSRGLDSLLTTRASYDARTHMVSGLELLADELVTIGDADEITVTMTKRLSGMDTDTTGCRSLSMGLHVMKQLIDTKASFAPSQSEIAGLSALASRCIESKESAVRMDAVQLCVALHSRIGEQKFWESMKDIKEDPKNLITYYIVKRQRDDTPT